MSKILLKVLQVIKKQETDVIAAVADMNNFAHWKVLEKALYSYLMGL
jgi:hypothetical protein